jgi:hypothetical protein
MIDFIRMNYKDKSQIEPFICDVDNFKELRVVLEQHSGVIEYPYKTCLETIDITVTEKNVCVMNSLHKLHNHQNKKGNKNHNDFKYSELTKTIDFLLENLINLEQSNLSKLEFGLNIELDIPAENIIRNNIMMHQFKIHNHNKKFDGKGEFKQFDHSNYDFKIYDKAKQYKLTNNVIRFEIKHKRSKSFNPLEIYNITDLKSKDFLQSLFEDLMKRFEELTIIDSYKNNSNIPENVRTAIETYTSYNFWELLSKRPLRNKKRQERMKFNQLLIDNNLLKTKTELRNKLNSKFQFLINN